VHPEVRKAVFHQFASMDCKGSLAAVNLAYFTGLLFILIMFVDQRWLVKVRTGLSKSLGSTTSSVVRGVMQLVIQNMNIQHVFSPNLPDLENPSCAANDWDQTIYYVTCVVTFFILVPAVTL
jgi:hypothetical protein